LKQQDRTLRSALGASDVRSLLIVSGTDQEQVLRTAERLRPSLVQWMDTGDIAAFDLVSDFFPSGMTQAARLSALPARDQLRANLIEATTDLPFRPDAFEPFLKSVEEARQSPGLHAQDLAGTAFGIKLGSLLRQDGDTWVLAVPLSGVSDAAALSAKAAALQLPGVQMIDLRAESVAMLSAYRNQALLYSALGSLLIYIVLAHGLRSPLRAWRVLMPIAVALVATALTLIVIGSPISIFHLVALLLVLGIGINYALFFLRATEMHDALPRTLQTLALVSGTTLCAFGTLAFARTPVLHAIGVTVTLGVVFSLVASMLLIGGPVPVRSRAQ
jgi:predicted exporter